MMKYGYDFYIIAGFLAGSILFGLLIGLYPASRPLLLLIGCYLLFAVVIPVKSNTRKSVYAFLLFTVLSIFTIPHRTMLMYGKEASNRKQEIDRQHYTIPNQRPKDKHCGKI